MAEWPNGEKIDPTRGEWMVIRIFRGEWHHILRDKDGNVRVYPILVGGTIGSMVMFLMVIES